MLAAGLRLTEQGAKKFYSWKSFYFVMKQIIKHFVNTVELEHKSIGTRKYMKYMSLLIDPIFIPAF